MNEHDDPSGQLESRRAALRRLGSGGIAALLVSRHLAPLDSLATPDLAANAGTDPAAIVEQYLTATNAHDINAVLALYAEDAAHVVMPPPPGHPTGVYVGREQISTFYEPTATTHDHLEVVAGTLQVRGNTVTYVKRVASDPWRKLGIDALDLNIYAVVAQGQFVTYIAMMTPQSVVRLFGALGLIPAPATPPAGTPTS
jgi:hypothetical protein